MSIEVNIILLFPVEEIPTFVVTEKCIRISEECFSGGLVLVTAYVDEDSVISAYDETSVVGLMDFLACNIHDPL